MKKYTPIITREKFFKLSKRKQIVTIAEDVIARIKLGLVKPAEGTFLRVVDLSSNEVDQAVVNQEPCVACAKGALVCAWLGNLNKFNADQFCLGSDAYGNGSEELLATFGGSLWNALEALFEGWDAREAAANQDHRIFDFEYTQWDVDDDLSVDDKRTLLSFDTYVEKLSHMTAKPKILLLMRNLIKNKGFLIGA